MSQNHGLRLLCMYGQLAVSAPQLILVRALFNLSITTSTKTTSIDNFLWLTC